MLPRLSFCIPTFNRADDLDRCFWSIYSAALHHGVLDEIEICLADNYSPDATPSVAKAWQERFPHFHFFRQEKHQHVLNNLESACHLSSGAYLWLFGDDDSIVPGTLGLVLDTCAKGPDFIHAAGITFTREGTGAHFIGVGGPRSIPVERLYAADIAQSACAYVSCLIFRRDVWLGSRRMAERHPREVTTQLQVVADCLEAGNSLAINTPCVMIDKTPSRSAMWNGYWAIMLGYEFFKASNRKFPARADGKADAGYSLVMLARFYGALSLLRDYYDGVYERAAALPTRNFSERLCQSVLGAAFSPRLVRNSLIDLLRRLSPKFGGKIERLGAIQASEQA